MKKRILPKISIAFVFCLLVGFTAAQAQTKTCGIELNVTEANADGNPILSAPSTATNLATKKTVKAAFFEGYPTFGSLREGKYKITVTKSGYKTTVKEIKLDCGQADEDQNSVTENIFLQKGSSKKIYRQPDSDDGTAEKPKSNS